MTDRDIDRWSANWRESAPAPADLARLARREARQIAAWIALDWIVGAGLLAFAAWLWFDDGTPVMRFAAAGIAVLTLVALAFTTINWRGSFRGERAASADYLALALERSRARLRYIRFGWWVLAADLLVIAGAFLIEIRDEGLARLPGMLASAALATGVAAAVLYFLGRRESRKQARLAALQRAMRADTENSHE
jgi:drug/metabolite transporter (DMT)-like permease